MQIDLASLDRPLSCIHSWAFLVGLLKLKQILHVNVFLFTVWCSLLFL